jgi:adenylate cyclase
VTERPTRRTPDDLERLLLGAERKYTREEVAARVGLTVEEARVYWRALGFADVGEAVAFTIWDIEVLRGVLELVESRRIDQPTAVQMVRALGRMTGRLAEWHVETMASIVEATADDRYEPDDRAEDASDRGDASDRSDASDASDRSDAGEDGDRSATNATASGRLATAYQLAEQLLPEFERLLIYAWRRKLAAAAGRMVTVGDLSDTSVLRARMTIGFADLVSFTRLSRGLAATALADLVEAFEATSNDVIAGGGGRVIKTLGDEVLFVADTPDVAARIACQLVTDIGRNQELPDIRVGLATGPVVTRLGDVFGTATNLAARLTAQAGRNVVLADAETAMELTAHPDFAVRALPTTELRGIGVVAPYQVVVRPAVGSPS